MYRFLRRPRWVLLTAGTVLSMVLMVNLSFWQLRRLDERRTANREVSSRSTSAPAALDAVLPPTAAVGAIGDAEWRRVEVTGTYDLAHQVLVNDRSFSGLPGAHVVTPLVLADGRGLLVNRGWVPAADKVGQLPTAPDPPTGTVTVIGRVRPSQTRGFLGPTDAADGTLALLARVDVPRIGRQVPYPLVPAYVELVRTDDGTLPRPIPLPELDDGPHLSYAGQWLLFTLLAAAGWVALVRRHGKLARQAARRAELAAAAADADATAADGTTPDDGTTPGPADATAAGPGTASAAGGGEQVAGVAPGEPAP